MSVPKPPLPAKLFVGLLFSDAKKCREAIMRLHEHFGSIDMVTQPRPFTESSYYDKEMGKPIFRSFLSFERLVSPQTLPEIKLFTNDLETSLAVEGSRKVNIDPGILSEERLVLATGKNYTHRIYIRDGIYADLTLIYRRGGYQPLDWTYPDYRDPLLLHFLKVLRLKLVALRKHSIP
ncbi:MAG: DUF4416 family protein [Syntrophobacterales bacterium]|nr:DUF4416 family protein [Syntrophobacterales bacterium]